MKPSANEKEYRFERTCANPSCCRIFYTNITTKKYCGDGCRNEHYIEKGIHKRVKKPKKPAASDQDRTAMLNNQFLMMPLVKG